MSWNYRVVLKNNCYGIHIAHYKTKRHKRPHSISVCPITMVIDGDEGVGGLENDLDMMKAAFDKPVLKYEDFDKKPK